MVVGASVTLENISDEEMKEFAESYIYLFEMTDRVPREDRDKIITALIALRAQYDCCLNIRELYKLCKECDG